MWVARTVDSIAVNLDENHTHKKNIQEWVIPSFVYWLLNWFEGEVE